MSVGSMGRCIDSNRCARPYAPSDPAPPWRLCRTSCICASSRRARTGCDWPAPGDSASSCCNTCRCVRCHCAGAHAIATNPCFSATSRRWSIACEADRCASDSVIERFSRSGMFWHRYHRFWWCCIGDRTVCARGWRLCYRSWIKMHVTLWKATESVFTLTFSRKYRRSVAVFLSSLHDGLPLCAVSDGTVWWIFDRICRTQIACRPATYASVPCDRPGRICCQKICGMLNTWNETLSQWKFLD